MLALTIRLRVCMYSTVRSQFSVFSSPQIFLGWFLSSFFVFLCDKILSNENPWTEPAESRTQLKEEKRRFIFETRH
jgi:hypothetical protein